VHGEPEESEALRAALRSRLDVRAFVPRDDELVRVV
jgi:hypothetical protein